jgi:uncharacterized protein
MDQIRKVDGERQVVGKSSAARSSAPWGFWATLGWGAAAILAPTAIVSLCWQFWLSGDPAFENAMLMLAAVGTIGVVLTAIRISGWSIVSYLALTVPSKLDVLLGVVSPIILMAVYFATVKLAGIPTAEPTSIRFELLFFLSVVLVTPVSEELVYRGFLYRGWAQSMLGAWCAILLIAAAFSVAHEGGYIKVYCSGLLYGWLRWRTASTTVPIIAHATTNLATLALQLYGIQLITY